MTEARFPFIMTLGEFREKTKNLPDDTILVTEYDEFYYTELRINHIFKQTKKYPAVILLEGSQVVNSELGMHKRVDKWLGINHRKECSKEEHDINN